MISVDEFRDSYINEDINAAAINTSTHPVDVFIEIPFSIFTISVYPFPTIARWSFLFVR